MGPFYFLINYNFNYYNFEYLTDLKQSQERDLGASLKATLKIFIENEFQIGKWATNFWL